MKTLNQLKLNVPSIFATSASPKMSDKYVFVPTIDILENFEREEFVASNRQDTLVEATQVEVEQHRWCCKEIYNWGC